MKANIIIAMVIAAVFPCLAKAAVEDSVLVRRVLDYYETAAPERLVIHTDKDECAPGGKVSFRAYVVSAADNFDSQLSNFIYLDLYRNSGWQRISHKKYIRNENGSFSNYLDIPETLESGVYTIVGYTRHMLGFPSETFAYHPIKVGEEAHGDTASGIGYGIELSPEGGHYVEGAVQRVGVRIAGDGGVTGVLHVEVADSAGQVIYSTDTDCHGYATVKLRNDSLTPLRVNVCKGDGYVLSTEIPKAETDCAALKVSKGEDAIKIGILSNGDIDLSALNVVVRASGVVLSMAADRVSQVKIPLNTLPDGSICIDLVDDAARKVVSSRRIFKEYTQDIRLTR